MNGLELLTGPLAQAIGWALLHLLWQGAIVAGILAAVLALMVRQTANARYVVSCGALALVFAMFAGTAVRAYDPAAAPIEKMVAAGAAEPVKISLSELPLLLAETAAVGLRDGVLDALSAARTALPSVVAIWLAGVVLLSVRLLFSWMAARRLVHQAAQPADRQWQHIAERLSSALGLRRAVELLESAAVEVPSVIGTLRPIILLPASALTGLTPEQIEMVLAHEMAHIRRHDFLVNLLQAVVETLMFYHPAVWWMSRRVRIERENCCDDLAVSVCGNPIQYARALTRLEELRATSLPVLVAANGGSLLDRIRRIATGRQEGTSSSSRWAAAVAMLSILILVVAVPSLPALAQRDATKTAPPAEPSKAAEAAVEVVEASPETASADAEDADLDDVSFDQVFDFDLDVPAPEAPEPPDAPEWPHPVIAPRAPFPPHPAFAPVPAIAPVPRMTPMAMPVIAPMAPHAPAAPDAPPTPPVGRAPRAPRPPQFALSMGDADFDFDFDFDLDDDDDDDESTDRASREVSAGGKLSVDELVALRAHNITPAYIHAMRELFPSARMKQVAGMKAVGVTPEFLRDMRAAGLEVKSANAATSLRAVGVTAEFIKGMRAAGLEVKSANDATSLSAVGVTPEFIQQMRGAGFAIRSANDATSLRAVGVNPAWVSELRAAGVEIRKASDATSLRALGVDADFVKRLAKSGYLNLSVGELSRLAALGIDDDFIRDMEQYRKKN